MQWWCLGSRRAVSKGAPIRNETTKRPFNPKYAEIIAEMKTQLEQARERLNETDNNPEIQAIMEKHWKKQ
jgi:hypothetical protein